MTAITALFIAYKIRAHRAKKKEKALQDEKDKAYNEAWNKEFHRVLHYTDALKATHIVLEKQTDNNNLDLNLKQFESEPEGTYPALLSSFQKYDFQKDVSSDYKNKNLLIKYCQNKTLNLKNFISHFKERYEILRKEFFTIFPEGPLEVGDILVETQRRAFQEDYKENNEKTCKRILNTIGHVVYYLYCITPHETLYRAVKDSVEQKNIMREGLFKEIKTWKIECHIENGTTMNYHVLDKKYENKLRAYLELVAQDNQQVQNALSNLYNYISNSNFGAFEWYKSRTTEPQTQMVFNNFCKSNRRNTLFYVLFILHEKDLLPEKEQKEWQSFYDHLFESFEKEYDLKEST